MPHKNIEDRRAYDRAWIKKNRTRRRPKTNAIARRNRQKKKIRAIKEKGEVCIKCGLKYNGHNGAKFDFHHVDPKLDSKANIKFALGWKKIEQQLIGTVLICANCHRMEHSEEY